MGLVKGEIERHSNRHTSCCVKMKAEIGVPFLQAKECGRLPANRQQLSWVHGADSLSEPSEGTTPANTLNSDF